MREFRKENIKNICGMTPMQEAMMYRKLVEEDSNAYFEQIAFTIRGDLNIDYFRRAWNIIGSRHDILRTAFVFENTAKPLQIVLKEGDLEFNTFENQATCERIEAYKESDKQRGFDLKSDPLMRFAIFKLSEREHRIVWSFHHIIIDGWCNKILFDEFERIYNALTRHESISLPPAPQFASYVKWLGEQTGEKAADYWKEYLRGYDTLASFPKKERNNSNYRLAKNAFSIPIAQTEELMRIAAELRVTLPTLIKTIWGVLLSRFNDTDDVAFGSTVSGRQAPVKDIEGIVGLFINTVPQRIKYGAGTKFTDLLREVQKELLAQGEYDYYSLAEIESFTALKENLFNNILVFENYPVDSAAESSSGLEFTDFEDFEQTDYGMSVYISFGNTINFCVKYNAEEYSKETIQQIENGINRIVDQVCKCPDTLVDDIEVFSLEPSRAIELKSNDSYPSEISTIPALFKRQVDLTPNKACLVFKGKELTYAQLDQLSDHIANRILNEIMAGRNQVTAILLSRSMNLVAAMLGALKSGCAYLPLSPDYPDSRIEYILNKSRAKVLITESGLIDSARGPFNGSIIDVDSIDFDAEASAPEVEIGEDDPAYLLFTSGSTGKPKGILNKHSSVASFLPNMSRVFGLDGEARFYAITTPTFDISILEILCNLLNGTTVILSSDETGTDPEEFKNEIIESRANAIQTTPSRLSALIDAMGVGFLGNMRTILVGGEVFPVALARKLSVLKNANVFNVYGPTETTIWSTCKLIESNEITIGKPLIGERIYILDRHKRPMPTGAIGEIYISGPQAALGYWDDEELTEKAFLNDPFVKGERMFKTGDYGRVNNKNEIEFLGRKDFQVKIRGFRIELQEIERALERYPDVSRAAVVARADDGGESYLDAFMHTSSDIDPNDVLRFLSRELPEYMIPANIIALGSLPVTENGKIDRKALQSHRSTAQNSFEPPTTDIQRKILDVWRQILGAGDYGVNESFISLGGHSLKAVRMISLFNKEFGTKITLGQFFAEPNIKGLEKLLAKGAVGREAEIPKAEIKEYYDLSPSQKALWTVCADPSATAAYNMPSAYAVSGRIDVEILEKSINQVVAAHEILRTRFALVDDQPKQVVLPGLSARIEILDCEADRIDEEIARRSRRAFNLEAPPLFEIVLFRVNPDKSILFFNIHHIITDAQSQEIFFEEVRKRYEAMLSGNSVAEDKSELTFKDYAEWTLHKNSASSGEDKKYWLEKFKSAPAPAELPLKTKRSSIRTFEGRICSNVVDAKRMERVNDLLRATGITPFSFYSGLLQLLLHKYTSQCDITLGTVFSGRESHSLQQMMGFFAKTVAIRQTIDPSESLEGFLKRNQKTIHEDFSRQNYNYDELLKNLAIPLDSGRNPLFDYMVIYQKDRSASSSLGGVRVEDYRIGFDFARFDLSYHFIESDALRIELNYNAELFDSDIIGTVLSHIKRLIEEIEALLNKRIRDISLYNDILSLETASALRNTTTFGDSLTIHEMFSRVAAKNGEALALITEERTWTYGELEEDSSRLANLLVGFYQVKPGDRIGVCIDRGYDWIISLLAILKAGAVYVPLDPKSPRERNEEILKSASIGFIISSSDVYSEIARRVDIELAATCPPELNKASTDPRSPAYIIFTSGSTGKPKGVELCHRGLVSMALSQIDGFGITSTDRVLQFASPAFDASLSEVFMAFFAGAALAVIDDSKKIDPEEFERFVNNNCISAATIPPALQPLLDAGNLSPLRIVISAGEIPNKEFAKRISNTAAFFNAYGPTETSVCASFHRVIPGDLKREAIPIGKPVSDSRIYILNENLEILPIGFSGEICIAGIGLSNGYINDEAQTRQRFLYVPSINDFVYRTGDIGKIDSHGNLIFIGRKDDQLKIRGFRVEPGEIKKAAEEAEGVTNSEIVVVDRPAGKEIRCYYIGDSVQPDELLGRMKMKLPGYMAPACCVKLDKFPMTSSGKTDVSALRAIEPEKGNGFASPKSKLEKEILSVFRDVLKKSYIEVTDSFFDVGGDSIAAVILSKRIGERVERKLAANDIYSLKSAREIAAHIEREGLSSSIKTFNYGAQVEAFAFPSVFGLAEEYVPLAEEMKDVALHCFEFCDEPIEFYVDKIAEIRGGKAPIIIGYSLGGALAFAVANALESSGRSVGRLCLIDPPALDEDFFQHAEENVRYLVETYAGGEAESQLRARMNDYIDYLKDNFRQEPISAQTIILISEESRKDEKIKFWQALCKKELILRGGAGPHLSMLSRPFAAKNGEILKEFLAFK